MISYLWSNHHILLSQNYGSAQIRFPWAFIRITMVNVFIPLL